jgi:alpha-galactosidase
MASSPEPRCFRLDGEAATLVVAIVQDLPTIAWWGPRLPDDCDLGQLLRLAARAEAPASPAIEPVLALTPQAGQGWIGRPGLAAHRDGKGWAPLAHVTGIGEAPGRIAITSHDPAHGVTLEHALHLAAGDVLIATTRLTNAGKSVLTVDDLVAPLLPLPAHIDRCIGFEGRWAGEFAAQAQQRQTGIWLRENRRGRTSHDAFPGLIATAAETGESHGAAYGFHLGWSGNHRLFVETLADGRAQIGMGELLLPGEVRLGPGESLTTPPLFAAFSAAGLSGIARAFHRYLRARPEHARLRARPRPVHFNSWEAVYFDHDPAALMAMATRAASIGVERFVLDDGWFRNRRSDRAGLGDWTVDPQVYPQGLAPLIDHVRGLGMEFGLWIEPEMVSPDSDLYRRHSDWVLAAPPAPQLGFRHQLVLDFGRAAVRDHLFTAIDALLRDHPIAYLKWDMNRDINHPGGADGRAGARAHVRGVHAVLDRLRAAHSGVEIESCASGGGRADFAMLARTDRIWTSDSNDALDRLAIQAGFMRFFPPEVMGAHVGPATCHITGRRLPMALRVASAMFGHMGIELDLAAAAAEDLDELAGGVALHKQHRALIHGGDFFRLPAAPGADAFAVLAPDRSEALIAYTQITEPRSSFAGPLRLAGLDPDADYNFMAIWPQPAPHLWPRAMGGVFRGALLMQAGWQPPRLKPGTALIVHLVRQAGAT